MHLKQFDVKTAFLNGKLNETVYMHQPEGFTNSNKNQVCKLNKSLYGLKQSAKCWNDKFVKCLSDFGLHVTSADPCVFVNVGTQEKIILVLYVDDGGIACKDPQRIQDLLNHLKNYFEITDCNLNIFLGIEITYKENGILFACQKFFADKMVQKFNLSDAHSVSIPMDPHEKLEFFEEAKALNRKVPYKEAIGSLMFLGMVTRPDIAFAVGVLSRHAENPKKAHWNAKAHNKIC